MAYSFTVHSNYVLEESLGCFRVYFNGLYGSSSRWIVSKENENPAESDLQFLSKKAAKLHMEDCICSMINRKLGTETALTSRQQKAILRKIRKRI